MAPKKAQSKRTPSPASSYTSSSEDEPEAQVKPSQVASKTSGAALKAPQSTPHKRPQSSSSSEDDTEESSDDSDSTNQAKLDVKVPPQQEAAAPSDSDSESESESESESDEDTPHASVKPAMSKPTNDESASTSKKRRVSEVMPSPLSKDETNEAARKRFERLWSPEDELVILKSVLAFKRKYSHEPTSIAEADILYNETKKSFHADFSRPQFGTKLGNLRRKYSRLLKEDHLPKKKSANINAAFNIAKEIWGEPNEIEGTKHEGGNLDLEMNGALDNDGKSSKVIVPKSDFVDRLDKLAEKSKVDNAKGSISEEDNTKSLIIDFVADEFSLVAKDTLNKSFARLGPADCKTIFQIWNNLILREMEFQIDRLDAAKEIIKVLKGDRNMEG